MSITIFSRRTNNKICTLFYTKYLLDCAIELLKSDYPFSKYYYKWTY